MADAVGLHQNTVRGHLDVLVDAGYAVRRAEAPRGPGRPRIVYEATAAPESGSNYKLIAEVLAEYVGEHRREPSPGGRRGRGAPGQPVHHGPGDEPAEAPDTSTHADAQTVLDGLVRLLADGGFQPEVVNSGEEIHLHHCPFGELAVTHPDVVCGAHLGIIQASVAKLGGPVGGTRLLPLVQPQLCVARIDGEPAPASRPA